MQQRRGEILSWPRGVPDGEPATIAPGEFASSALRLMEQRKITSVVVVDGERRAARRRASARSLDARTVLDKWRGAIASCLEPRQILPKPRIAAAVAARARKIRLLLLDVDGVLTNGLSVCSRSRTARGGNEAFHSQDGAGL